MKFVIAGFAFCTLIWVTARYPATAGIPDAAFMSATSAAMTKMMAAMGSEPSGDADDDFARVMVPHHQGAIDMALAELHYGQNERLRRIAQEIIITQQAEIAAMRLAVREPLAQPVRRPDEPPQ